MSELVIRPDGKQEWYVNDQRHRIDGPAIVYPDGTVEWWIDGFLHRTDGPAMVYPNGTQVWYVDGTRCYSDKEYRGAANLTDEDMTAIVLKYGNVS